MKKLNRQIFIYFIFIILLIFLVMTITDYVFEFILEKYLRTPLQLAFFAVLRLLIDIGLIGGGALLFRRMSGRSFEKEARLQREKEHLLYASLLHDIKTPLTSIKGYTRALLDEKVDNPQSAYEVILKKSDQMNEMVESLFDYTKLSAGSLKLTKSETNISELVKEVLADAYDAIEARGDELSLHLPETAVFAHVDAGECRRLFSNLIQNAIQHNPVGTKLEISVKESPEHVVIDFSDDGVDIENNRREDLFTPFYKKDEARSSSGSGLGLAIADQIARSHGGKITIIDEKNPMVKSFRVTLSKRDI